MREHGLTILTIRLSLYQHRTAALTHALEAFVGYTVDGHHIVAVDGDAGQAVPLRFQGEVHPSVARLRAGPGIVLDHKDDGQAAPGGEFERFTPAAESGCRHTVESDHHVGIVLLLVG